MPPVDPSLPSRPGAGLVRRRGRTAALLGLALALAAALRAVEPLAIDPANRVDAGAPEWRALVAQFAAQPDAVADFEEQRFFPFRNDPVTLKGEVRVSRARGLSLHYTAPDARTVILDAQGVLLRDPGGDHVPPDTRSGAANQALLHVLRLDFPALEKDFEIYGRCGAAGWSLALVPRAEGLRRAIGDIHVAGEGTAVRTIALRRSAKQHIEIAIAPPRAAAAFTADEAKRYFR